MKEMSFIAAQNISMVFGESPEPVTALNKVSLEIAKGDFIAIMGPSGSGKTSLSLTERLFIPYPERNEPTSAPSASALSFSNCT
jgi:ABC-type glutathione transport system ATPase component